jgi:short-subunit dehydrogenase
MRRRSISGIDWQGMQRKSSHNMKNVERRKMPMKSILITGAASGIGYETALLFSRNGWFVGLFDRNEAGLTSLQRSIGEHNCCLQVMDTTDPESFREALERFTQKTDGKMDVLFNNAGIARNGFFEHVDLNDHHAVIDVNLKGVLNGIYLSLGALKKTAGSRIINMASTSIFYGIPEIAVYSAVKRAIYAMTEALDLELENYGITVCDIVVAYVKTPMVLDAPHKPFSVEKMGVRVESSTVANTVWQAAHRKKLHWKIGWSTYLLAAFMWAFPFTKRFIIKALTIPPKES